MKPIIKIKNLKILSDKFVGITLFPYIFIRKSYYDTVSNNRIENTIRHEKIHFKQQIELLIIFFYLWYGIEYLIKFITYGVNAYKNISFEREAYGNEEKLNYLENRKFWTFLKYL